MKLYSNELLNPSVETINSIVEDIVDLLQDNLHLPSPYKSVFLMSSSFSVKCFHQFSYYWDCLAD